MPIVIVWDCETDTQLPRESPHERDLAISRSEVTVLCCLVFDSEDAMKPGNFEFARQAASKYTFWRDNARHGQAPFEPVLSLFDQAEAIVAYNGFGFDLRVLSKYYGNTKDSKHRRTRHRLKMLDPMVCVAQALDIRFPSLDALLHSNGLGGKTSNGLEAIRMWQEERRDELEEYCWSDVEGLAKLVFLQRLHVPGCGSLPNRVHGIASFLQVQRILAPMATEGDWMLVDHATGTERLANGWVEIPATAAH